MKKTKSILMFSILVLFISTSSHAQNFTCDNFDKAKRVGYLAKSLKEASGLEMSQTQPQLYHINDGHGAKSIFVTELSGRIISEIPLVGSGFGDTEDLSLFNCGARDCLLVGGTGDNHSHAKSISFAVFEEPVGHEQSLAPIHTFHAVYSDGARDAEAFAVHPNGDLIVITKEYSKGLKPFGPPRIYRLKKEVWENAGSEPVVLQFESILDIKKFNPTSVFLGRLVTGMDISSDGTKFIIMTYTSAFEFAHDFSTVFDSEKIKSTGAYKKIKLKRRIQQEAIAYREDQPGIIYTSESPSFDPYTPFKRRGLLAQVLCQP